MKIVSSTRPPVAERIPYSYSRHGLTVEDPYAWLKDPGYPEVTDERVLDYLRAENEYFEHCMGPHRPLVKNLFEELKARQPQEDSSVPYRKNGYWYQWRFEHGAQYRLWLRAPAGDPHATPPAESDPAWRVILDEPRLAEEHNYFVLGGLAVSPDGRHIAWNADTNGSERFTLHVKDLERDVVLDEVITDTLASPVWTADGSKLLYVLVNEQWRPYQVRLHRLGTPTSDDKLLYEERDDSFFVGIDKTSSEAFILISTGDHVTSEVRCVPADAPEAEQRLFAARRSGHEYAVDHGEGFFYVMSNAEHKNFALLRTLDDAPGEEHWQTLVTGAENHYLTWFARFRGRLVIGERIDAMDQVRVIEDAGEDYLLEFPEPIHTVGLGANPDYDTATLRVIYQSMITPDTVFDFHFADRRLQHLKTLVVPSGHDKSLYTVERITAPARDGAEVPVSLVYRRDLPAGEHPLYLTGYGAYGMPTLPGFSPNRLSLLDRGFVYAIAHIRGGDELGYAWYEAGKLDKRTNTFNDFVDVARHLVAQGHTRPGRIAISGGSAGGELMGAVVNQAPELWGAVVAHVPFMDVLNTMQDTSLPLTPIEWPEWGNPIEDASAFELIRSYSPYDQLQPGEYPPMLVTAGLNDPRVTYWEPAKYVAKLRTLKRDGNWLLLKTNMDAGHRGQSGRFEVLEELAEEFTFILVSLGMV